MSRILTAMGALEWPLGAICVASAVFLILELSDPYSGLFRMPREGFDGLVRIRRGDVGSKFTAEFHRT